MVCRVTSLAVGGRKARVGQGCAQGRGPQAWEKNIEIATHPKSEAAEGPSRAASHCPKPKPSLASYLPPSIGSFSVGRPPFSTGFPPSNMLPAPRFLSLPFSVERGRAGEVVHAPKGHMLPISGGRAQTLLRLLKGAPASDKPLMPPGRGSSSRQAPPTTRPQPRSSGPNSIVHC